MESSFDVMKELSKQIFDFLKKEKNLGAVTWISTAFAAVSVALLKFYKFVSESGKLAYWKISPSVINVATDNILYDIIVSAVFAIVILALFLIPYFIAKSKIKKWVKVLLFGSLVVGLSVLFFFGSNAMGIIRNSFWVGLWAFLFADLLFLAMFFLPSVAFLIATRPQKSQTKPMTKKGAVILLMILIAVNILYFYFAGYYTAAMTTEYRITTDGYAIVYETDDLYYLSEFDVENKRILKENQKVIEKTNVDYTWKSIKE